MKKKGFTLVELLAVIVILAIIAVIAVPIIIGIIKDAKYKAAVESLKGYLDAAEKTITLNELEEEEDFPEADNNGCYNLKDLDKKIEVKGNRPTGIKDSDKICFEDGETKKLDEIEINSYKMSYKKGRIKINGKIIKIDSNPPTVIIKNSISDQHKIVISMEINDSESEIEKVTCKYSKENGIYTENATSVNENECKLQDIEPNKMHYYQICATDIDGNKTCKEGEKATTNFIYTDLSENIISSNSWYNGTFTRVDANTIKTEVNNNQVFLRHDISSISGIKNHKIYILLLIKKDNTSLSNALWIITASNVASFPSDATEYMGWDSSKINEWFKSSVYFTATKDRLTNVMLVQGNANAIGTVYFKNLKTVDLTAIFGAGNEPSKEWCDKYIN